MKTREIAVPNDGREMTVVLEADAERLEEVIVTGYGTFKKSAYAGSASTVKNADVERYSGCFIFTGITGSRTGYTDQCRFRSAGCFY